EDGIRDFHVTGVQTCALPISGPRVPGLPGGERHARGGREQRARALGHHALDGDRDVLHRGAPHPAALERIDPAVEDLHGVPGPPYRVRRDRHGAACRTHDAPPPTGRSRSRTRTSTRASSVIRYGAASAACCGSPSPCSRKPSASATPNSRHAATTPATRVPPSITATTATQPRPALIPS